MTESVLKPLDIRSRILAASGSALLFACITKLHLLFLAVVLALIFFICSSFRPARLLPALKHINMLLLILFSVVAFSTEGSAIITAGSFAITREGVHAGLLFILRGNAVILWVLLLTGDMDAVTFAGALRRLKLPRGLVEIFFLTFRYMDVLRAEARRLHQAALLRAFQPQMNMHTLRTFGYFTGALFVRSFQRADRVAAAMKCRGFQGEYPSAQRWKFTGIDIIFAFSFLLTAALFLWLEYR